MQYELKKAEEKAEALKSLDKLRTKLENKECELAWAVVAQKEAEHESMARKTHGLQKKRPKIEEKLNKAKVCVWNFVTASHHRFKILDHSLIEY